MANCCPLGSAFDDDWKSLLAILLPERWGDTILVTSMLLYLSSLMQVLILQSLSHVTRIASILATTC
jgi:hypothetical protein